MLSTCRKDNALNAENQMFRLRCTSCPAEASSIFSPLLWRASPRRPGSSVPPIVSESLRGDAQHGILSDAQPKQRRKGRKSMSRRSGQSGTLVKQTGWWRVRFRLDQPGGERRHMSAKVAPVSMGLTKPELERRAKEIVQNAGANSEERFNRVVLGEVTFREQAKIYLQTAISRLLMWTISPLNHSLKKCLLLL